MQYFITPELINKMYAMIPSKALVEIWASSKFFTVVDNFIVELGPQIGDRVLCQAVETL